MPKNENHYISGKYSTFFKDDSAAFYISQAAMQPKRYQPRIFEIGEFKIILYGFIKTSGIISDRKIAEKLAAASRGKKLKQTINSDISGQFLIFIIDPAAGRIEIINDRYGSHHLYYSTRGNSLFFSTEIFDLMKSGLIDFKYNTESVYELFTYELYLLNKTLIQNLYRLNGASIFSFDLSSGKSDINLYWDYDLSDRIDTAVPYNSILKKTGALLKKAVNEQINDGDSNFLFLSGGLDSRVILADFDKDNFKIETGCYSAKKKCYDYICSKGVADSYATPHHFFKLSAEKCAACWEENAKNLFVPSLRFLKDSAVFKQMPAEFNNYLYGVSGDPLFGSCILPRNFANADEAVNFVFEKRHIKNKESSAQFFGNSEYINIMQKNTFNDSVSFFANKSVSFDLLLTYFILRNVALQLNRDLFALSRFHGNYVFPFLNYEFVDFITGLPKNYLLHRKIQIDYLVAEHSELNHIKWQNTNRLLTSGKYTIEGFDKKVLLAEHALKKIIERISFGKLSYHPMHYEIPEEHWIRSSAIKNKLSDIIFHSQTEVFSIIDRHTAESFFNRHMRGIDNYARYIYLLAGLILWEKSMKAAIAEGN